MNHRIARKDFLKFAQYDNRLLQLETRIKAHSNLKRINKNYCANSAWYKIFKKEVCGLVGWDADDIRLQSTEAYDTVYNYLYNLLPDCTCQSLICGSWN